MFKLTRQPILIKAVPESLRYVPIEVVDKLRPDPAWKDVIEHLEQGKLGLKIKYGKAEEEMKQAEQEVPQEAVATEKKAGLEVKELEQKVREEVNKLNLKEEVRDVKEISETVRGEVSQLKADVDKLKLKEKIKVERKNTSKKIRDSTKTSIQVSREFKGKLKAIKGSRSYEEFLKERVAV